MISRVTASVPLLLGALAHNTYAAPGACEGVCNIHDPGLTQRDDGTYFRFSTGGALAIASAPSLEGPWTDAGTVLPEGSADTWAPDVSKVGDTYNLYYSVSTFGSQISSIGLATSEDLETWTDQGEILSSDGSGDYNAIDANLFQSGDSAFLTFGSFFGGLFQVEISPDGTTTSGEPYNLAFEPAGEHAIEAPFIYENDGSYYLFFSHGMCCNYDENMPPAGAEYRIKVCRSDSPSGPFTDQEGVACTEGGGTVVYESTDNIYGPGGQGVFNDPELGAVVYYHYVDTDIGYADGQKLFGWNALNWTDGWPSV